MVPGNRSDRSGQDCLPGPTPRLDDYRRPRKRHCGAAGVDLADGSEVKSCSRADQLGACKDADCLSPVLPHEAVCPQCGGSSITRKDDSHWILVIKSKQELDQYLEGPRIVLILFDR